MDEGVTAYYWLSAVLIFGVILFLMEFNKK